MKIKPDNEFSHPRLVPLYDFQDSQRSDLLHYVSMVKEFGASSVLDLGCGTGTFLSLLAEQDLKLIGVDPAEASLNVAKSKLNADRVHWILGDVNQVSNVSVDMVFMTGNVAQIFSDDDVWLNTLKKINTLITHSGYLIFEARKPEQKGWHEWTREKTYSDIEVPAVGRVQSWCEVTNVSLPMVTFEWTYIFGSDGAVLKSQSTLCFRSREEIEHSLNAAGFSVIDVRDAPDRPGKEFVFVSQFAKQDL